MGNSGSMPGLASYEEGGYHHHHQRYYDAMRGEAGAGGAMSSTWMDSYQRGEGGRRGGEPRDYDYLYHMHEQKLDEGGHFNGNQQGQAPQQQQQIKVLPDIPGKVAKLRSTNNGNILHAGGTISKNNQTLQRSKSISSPTYQQQQPASLYECDEPGQRGSEALPPRLQMTRSRTQMNMVVRADARGGRGRDAAGEKRSNGIPVEHRDGRVGHSNQERYGEPAGSDAAALNHRKRFGSEPDLRLSVGPPRNGAPAAEQEHGMGGAAARKPNAAQSKIMKGKNKKKAAPVPPLIEKRDFNKEVERQRSFVYSPQRKQNGTDSNISVMPSLGESNGFNATATRKLRLFKTRAETKKTPTIAKLPEASDAKFTSGHHSAAALSAGSMLMKQAAVPQPFHKSSTPSSSSSSSAVTAAKLMLAHHGQPPDQHSQQLHHAAPVMSHLEKHTAPTLDKSPPKPNPTSFFRREKTFDAGLLGLERKRAVEPQLKTKPTMSPPLSRRKSIVKNLLEQESGLGKARKDSVAAPPTPTAAQTVAITDFQKELQLMARRKQPPKFSSTTPAGNRHPHESSYVGGAAADTQQSSSTSSPCRGSQVTNGGSGEPSTRSPAKGKLLSSAAKALVIPVHSEKESDPVEAKLRRELPLAADGRDSSPPATPPPPPPPPKTSFYFGMCSGQRQVSPGSADQGDRSLPTSATDGLAEYFEDLKAQQFGANAKGDDSDDHVAHRDTGHEQHKAQETDGPTEPGEVDHTQMELIDQFAASLMNGSRYRSSDSVASSEADMRVSTVAGSWDDGFQEIALKLRPTLPRKQFDIPRFSPAAAWRLLTTDDEFCRDASHGMARPEEAGGDRVGKKLSASGLRVPPFDQEVDVPEDRIQRVYRVPVPGLQDNKSGDSGISGDAGLADLGEQSKEQISYSTPEGSPGKQMLQQGGTGGDAVLGCGGAMSGGWTSDALLLMPWTPQQDLEDEDDSTTGSGSDAPHLGPLIEGGTGCGREGNLADGVDFSSKGHLFSLSLPRENHLAIYNVEINDEKVEKHMFNSLQKFRKSVSGAFKHEESGAIDSNDNWFLGRLDTGTPGGARVGGSTNTDKRPKLLNPPSSYLSLERAGREKDAGTDSAGGAVSSSFAQNLHSSIGNLISGKHIMYLPREPTKLTHDSRDRSSSGGGKQDQNNNSRAYLNQNVGGGHETRLEQPQPVQQPAPQQMPQPWDMHRDREPSTGNELSSGGFGTDSLPPVEATAARRADKESLQDPVPVESGQSGAMHAGELEHLPVKLTNRRNHRFTFQSTIRQIEKRRVAEKLSREAEIKEAMRLSELEAMRRVEEEFQKKRAREKASIRHQLRLFSMENQPEQHDGHDDGIHDVTGDGKRSDPDGDSLPHQNTSGNGSGSSSKGLYRRKKFTSLERQRQYRRANDIAPEDGGKGKHGDTGYTNAFQQRHANSDDEDTHRYALDDPELAHEGPGDDCDDDGDTSTLGYVDTRTPYISRIIQAKSSKSYGARK